MPSAETRAIAQAKAAATRKARGTMGKNQRRHPRDPPAHAGGGRSGWDLAALHGERHALISGQRVTHKISLNSGPRWQFPAVPMKEDAPMKTTDSMNPLEMKLRLLIPGYETFH